MSIDFLTVLLLLTACCNCCTLQLTLLLHISSSQADRLHGQIASQLENQPVAAPDSACLSILWGSRQPSTRDTSSSYSFCALRQSPCAPGTCMQPGLGQGTPGHFRALRRSVVVGAVAAAAPPAAAAAAVPARRGVVAAAAVAGAVARAVLVAVAVAVPRARAVP